MAEWRDRSAGELMERAGLGEARSSHSRGFAVVALALGALLLVWRVWGTTGHGDTVVLEPQSHGEESATAGSSEASAVVHVVGAVARPGVYVVAAGSRVADAIRLAGGTLGNAAIDGVNLARPVCDGEQIVVPTQDESDGEGAAEGASRSSASAGGRLNLNRATAAELDALPGIGPSTAAKIVKDRELNGPFRAPEDLMRVSGIGPKKFEALKDLITTG